MFLVRGSGLQWGGGSNFGRFGIYGGRSASPDVIRKYVPVPPGTSKWLQLRIDPRIIGYRDVLEIFFATHDPTTLNRQGNDSGTQYRSVIFYHSPEQRAIAEEVIRELTAEKAFADPIVTAVEPATEFCPAEDYHQQYFENHPYQPYCAFVVSPKVQKFRKKFAERVKAAGG